MQCRRGSRGANRSTIASCAPRAPLRQPRGAVGAKLASVAALPEASHRARGVLSSCLAALFSLLEFPAAIAHQSHGGSVLARLHEADVEKGAGSYYRVRCADDHGGCELPRFFRESAALVHHRDPGLALDQAERD